MSLKKFEFKSKGMATKFINAHADQKGHMINLGQMPTAFEGEGEDRKPIAWTGFMVDTVGIEPLESYQEYEVKPRKPMHQILGREKEWEAQFLQDEVD